MRASRLALLFLFLFVSHAFAQQVPVLDPNLARFPRASLHDFSDLVEAPAGQHGFLGTKDGHLVWQDGTRARFWGINVANTSLQEPEAEIDAMIANFRRAGFNLIRLHHFDERDGILDSNAPDSRQFLPERLKKLDYWIHKARENGLYIYLDLLDYRRFKEGDGVPNAESLNRGGAPYNVFDSRLIELQKEYARELLREHVNAYTGLAYADDPTIVMLEIYNESGLFMKRGVWREMPEPYHTQFMHLWNEWLREQYKTSEALAIAWAGDDRVSALAQEESLEDGTVELPAMTWTPDKLPQSQRFWATAARRNDGARFAHELHIGYFREMRDYVRELGVKIPLTATGRFEDLADLKGISEELDYVATSFYYDHPYWGTGKPAWQPPSYYHNTDPLSDISERSFATSQSLARIRNKPFVVREWNYCWPNANRSSGILEAACYAALHDIDAMILFVYETKAAPAVGYFNVRSDPARWGLCGMAAQIFLRGLVAPSRHRVVVPYNAVDTFTYTPYSQPLYALGWTTRVENHFFDGGEYAVAEGDNTLIVPPGRSAIGTYSGGPAVLHTQSPMRDLAGHRAVPEYLSEYQLMPRLARNAVLQYNGVLFPYGARRRRTLQMGLPLAPLEAAKRRLIGAGRSVGLVQGFVDNVKKRLVFGDLSPDELLRATLDGLRLFGGTATDHRAAEHHTFVSDTAEIRRDAKRGRMRVSTPQAQILTGDLKESGAVAEPELGLRVKNGRQGTVVALSLDGEPLVRSRHFVIKMVADARNVDDTVGRDPRFLQNPRGQWMLSTLGRGPVTTMGRPQTEPVQIGIGNKAVLDVFMTGGSWELLVRDGLWQFYCDTGDIRFTFHRGALGVAVGDDVQLSQVRLNGTSAPLKVFATKGSVAARFPAGAALVQTGVVRAAVEDAT